MPKPLLVTNPQIASRTPKVLTVNQWTMMINDQLYYNITGVSGIHRKVGGSTRSDGSSGQVFNLTDHKISCGDLSIKKLIDLNDPADLKFGDLVTACHQSSTKYDGSLKKYNLQSEEAVMSVLFQGLLFREEVWPGFDVDQGGILEVTYTVSCDYYEVTFP
jgi:hypothetical protein